MKIVQQTNEQECGVCALVAIHNHIYNQFVSKEQALELSNISDTGMSIFDFETLGHKLGLECESYELNFAEFKNLKINSYFVLLLSIHGSSSHYVIARKKKEYIEIYDSCSSQVNKLSYSDLNKVFLNVLILVKKHPNKAFTKVFSKATTLLMFDLKFVLLNLGLSILILLLSVGSASFLNYIIDLAIAKSSVTNLFTICFIFILIYFCNDILTYVSNLYVSRNIKNNFVLFTSKILSSLEYKKSSFLNKVDKNWIFKVDECVYNIANFCVAEINKFITNIIFCVTCICIIGSIQYYLLIIVFLYAIIEFIFFLFNYRKKKEVFMSVIRNENSNAQFYKDLIISLNNEIWHSKRRTLIEKIKSNYSNIYKNYSDVILFKSNSNLFKSLLKSFSEICVIGLMSYLVIKQNNLSIGKLTFVISAFALYTNSTSEIANYFIYKLEFDVYWQVYKDLTLVSNVEENNSFKLEGKVKKISFAVDGSQFDLFTERLNNIKQPLVDIIRSTSNISVNNKIINTNKRFWESIIVLDQQSQPNIDLLLKQVETYPDVYTQYFKYFQIDVNKTNLTFYEQLIINFLNLLTESQKIILIDNVLSYVKAKDKVIFKQIINKLKKNNVVIINGKEEYD